MSEYHINHGKPNFNCFLLILGDGLNYLEHHVVELPNFQAAPVSEGQVQANNAVLERINQIEEENRSKLIRNFVSMII